MPTAVETRADQMAKRRMTKEEFLSSTTGKEELALMLFLLKESRSGLGTDSPMEAALYCTEIAQILDIEKEWSEALGQYPKVLMRMRDANSP